MHFTTESSRPLSRVLTFSDDPALAQRLRQVVTAVCDDVRELDSLLGVSEPTEMTKANSVVVLGVRYEWKLSPAAIAQLRSWNPLVQIVLASARVAPLVPQPAHWYRAGIDDVIRLEPSDAERLSALVRVRLSHCLQAALSRWALSEFPSSEPFGAWSLRNAWRPLSVSAVAERFEFSRETVCRRVIAERGCSARALIGWARAIHVALALDQTPRTATAIARALRFRSAGCMDALVRRNCSLSPLRLRREGALNTVLSRYPGRRKGANITLIDECHAPCLREASSTP